MPKPAKDGFPEPAVDFENPTEVREWVDALTEGGTISFTDVMIAGLDLGPLRAADPILADLIQYLRNAYGEVYDRLDQLHFFDSLADSEPSEGPATVQRTVGGALPEGLA